jgi:plasmid stabilization system protein ParE
VAAQILGSVELLATQPQMGRPGRVVGTRELIVPNTPFLIPYRVRARRLEIIAVFHGRQRWPEKL